MSLRHKLVLLLSGLTLTAVAIAVAVAHQEVRQSSHMAVDERMGRVAEQLAGLIQTSTDARRDLEDSLSVTPTVGAAFAGRVTDTTALAEALDELRSETEVGAAIYLLDAEGQPVHVDPPGSPPLPAALPLLDTVPRLGLLEEAEDYVRYWSTTPVRAGGAGLVGWIVQERRVGSAETAQQIEDLIGGGANVLLTLPGESLSMTLGGEVATVPLPTIPTGTLLSYEREGEELLARAAMAPNAPWIVVVETPASTVANRASTFLRSMTVLALLLVLGTVLVAYALGRRLVEPIEELAAGAEAVARGEYTGEVSSGRGGDELDSLARSFNEMAARVAATHAELKQRLDEQRALSAELEATTARAEEAREEAQRANEAKSEFLATMSHEVRTPINAILGYCDLLDLEIPDPLADQQREKVDRIRRASRILEGLVEDVLDFAKMDSGSLRFDQDVVDVEETVRDAAAVIEPQAEEKGLPVRMDVSPGLTLVADRRRMEQVLVNLLSNAVKFTESGSVEVVAIRETGGPPQVPGRSFRDRGEGWIRIDVADTGPGIATEQIERVFEPFVQSDTGFTRRHGGTGLGLSISRELARRMGGEVTVESRVGEGSRFTLWLPAVGMREEAGREIG